MNEYSVYELARYDVLFDRYIYLTPLALFLSDIFQVPTTQVLINLKKLFFVLARDLLFMKKKDNLVLLVE